MKKYVAWFLVAIFLLLLLFFMIQFAVNNYNPVWKSTADFDGYVDDFNRIRDYILSQYPNESDKYVAVSTANGSGVCLYDPDLQKYLRTPEEVLYSLGNVRRHAFLKTGYSLDVIRIHGNRIAFCIESGHYALVYSPNEKPTWVNSPQEKTAVRIKSIGDGWYHVVKNPYY